jgi:predicted membrane chloride channel (bestrophin family)
MPRPFTLPHSETIFGTLVYYAFRNRVNPASHKRLILIATIALMAAAINRWPFAVIQQSPFLIMGINDAFLLLLVANDLWSLHKVHLSTLWAACS